MNMQDLSSFLIPIKTFVESLGIDGDVLNILVMAIFTITIAWRSFQALKNASIFVYHKTFPSDPIVSEIVAALGGNRGEVVWNPKHNEFLFENMTLVVGLDRVGSVDELISLKANGVFQVLELLPAHGKKKIIKEANKRVVAYQQQEYKNKRESFLVAVRGK